MVFQIAIYGYNFFQMNNPKKLNDNIKEFDGNNIDEWKLQS